MLEMGKGRNYIKSMKATKNWGSCACNCGSDIKAGDEFMIVSGSMYLRGHEAKATGMIPVIKRDEELPKETE